MAKKNIKPIPKAPAKHTADSTVAEKKQPAIQWLSVKNLCLLLAVVSFVVYANTLPNGYALDDGMVLKDNTIVMKGIKAIPEILSTPRTLGVGIIKNDFYRPLSMIMFAVEVQLFGVSPAAGHFFNILVFAGCVIMLFLFLDKFFDGRKTPVAFIAALLFAIHPIHTEIVANIKSRDELLCYFFSFWSLCLFMNYMKHGKTSQLISGLLTFLLAFLSKETVVTFLVIIPLLFFFYKNNNTRRAVFMTGGAVMITIFFLIIRTLILDKYHANEPNSTIEFIDNALVRAPTAASRIATEWLILGKYLKLLLVPYPLLSGYAFNSIPYTGFNDIWVLLSLAAYVFIAFFGISRFIKNKKDPWAFAIIFFLITLALFSNLPFLIGAEMAERFLFFPSTGFCLVAALAIEKWIIRSQATDILVLKNVKVLAVLIPVFLIYSGMAIARNSDWKNNTTLYKADVAKSPNDGRLYWWLAHAITTEDYPQETDTAKQRQMDMESIGYLRKAAEIIPGWLETQQQLGFVFERERIYDSAIAHDLLAIKLAPENSTILNNLGTVYFTTGKFHDAIIYFKRCIAVKPDFKIVYLNIARSYVQLRNFDSSIYFFNKIQPSDSTYTFAQNGIAEAFLAQQNYDSAETHIKIIVSLRPQNSDAINNLGCVYMAAKNYPQAIEQFTKTLSLNPNNINALSNLGRSYIFTGQYQAAIATFHKELTLNPNNKNEYSYIVMAWNKMGKPDSAKKFEAIMK